jgi:hypothetical protein
MLKLLSPEEKQAQLDEAICKIENGEIIKVSSSSSSAMGLCIGDFRANGWSERCADRGGLWYDWNGPSAIIVDGVIIQPGGSTEYWEMDWS